MCTYCTLEGRPVLSAMSPFRSGAGRAGRGGGHRGTRVHIATPPQCRARRCSRSVGPAVSQHVRAAPAATVGSRPLLPPPLPPALQESNDKNLSLQQWATCYGWFTPLIVLIHYVRGEGMHNCRGVRPFINLSDLLSASLRMLHENRNLAS